MRPVPAVPSPGMFAAAAALPLTLALGQPSLQTWECLGAFLCPLRACLGSVWVCRRELGSSCAPRAGSVPSSCSQGRLQTVPGSISALQLGQHWAMVCLSQGSPRAGCGEKQWDGVPKCPWCCQCPCPAHSRHVQQVLAPSARVLCSACPQEQGLALALGPGRAQPVCSDCQGVQPEEGFGSSVLVVVWHCPVPAL